MYGTLYFTDDQLMLKKIGTKLVQNWYKNLYELVQKNWYKKCTKIWLSYYFEFKNSDFFILIKNPILHCLDTWIFFSNRKLY